MINSGKTSVKKKKVLYEDLSLNFRCFLSISKPFITYTRRSSPLFMVPDSWPEGRGNESRPHFDWDETLEA